MELNWQNWCRFCGKNDSEDIDSVYKIDSISNQMEIINKHFMISLLPFDGSLTSMCGDCCSFVGKLKGFSDRCLKAEKMFRELMAHKMASNVDFQSIRVKFGVDREEIKYRPAQRDQNEDSSMLDDTVDPSPDPLEMEESIEVKQEALESEDPPLTRERGRLKRLMASSTPPYGKVKRETDNEDRSREIKVKTDQGDDASDYDQGNNSSEPVEEGRPKRRRKKVYKDKIYLCTTCPKKYARPDWLRDHILQEHRPDEMAFVCSTCSKRFPTKVKLRLHESIHLPEDERRIFNCPFCEKKFATKGNMQTHVSSIHTKEKTFICEECGKSFKTEGALKEHHVTHTDERSYKCSLCPKTYKMKKTLKRHEETHADTTFDCHICGFKCKTKASLLSHMVVHSDVKKYKCNYCGNEYKRSTALKDHLILHTGQRPFECPFCDKTFANNSNCRNHKKKEHPLELAALEASLQQGREKDDVKRENLQ
ncbi:zinc finger protein 510-like [Lutzomyia longipalpis]|uniref:zinc finger protein 510-like n=1 Tax=Lutzomyia longipalpis TaxID=7200 RepID=UPI0024834FDE|nr:zinc finger protein 510-like [Lutzomyia longipalpis]